MPKVYRYSVDLIVDALKPLVDKGLAAVLIFGIVDASLKDEIGTYAGGRGYQSAVHHALQQLALAYPNLLLITDVCLCAYTSHGHCGILDSKGDLDNGASITRLAEVALSHVKAGAHMVAPSDMMDGRVLAIKQALIDEGLRVPVMAYSAKFCSGLYGPFRDVCNSAPSKFDRSSYQLPVGSK
jgi:porphobilinogen synthase